jgi:hypothetical protein
MHNEVAVKSSDPDPIVTSNMTSARTFTLMKSKHSLVVSEARLCLLALLSDWRSILHEA